MSLARKGKMTMVKVVCAGVPSFTEERVFKFFALAAKPGIKCTAQPFAFLQQFSEVLVLSPSFRVLQNDNLQ